MAKDVVSSVVCTMAKTLINNIVALMHAYMTRDSMNSCLQQRIN